MPPACSGRANKRASGVRSMSPIAPVNKITSACSVTIISRVMPMLIERERWADAGRLIRDPLAELRTHAAMLHMGRTFPMPDTVAPHRSALEETMLEGLRKEASQLVRSLQAAGRDVDAAAVKREALRLDDSRQMRDALR